MATSKIRTLGPGSLVIGSTGGSTGTTRDFSADITNVTLTPSADSDDPINYLDGTQEAAEPTITWELAFTVQDDYTKDGAAVWLFDHQGEQLHAIFTPNKGGDTKWTMDVVIVPIAIGGDVKSKPTNDVTLTATGVTHTSISGS